MVTYNCIHCFKTVSTRMHSVECGVCKRRQHRKCGTGISYDQYRRLTRGELHLDWRCVKCQVNSTSPSIPPPLEITTSPIRQLNTTFVISREEPATVQDSTPIDEPVTADDSTSHSPNIEQINPPKAPLDVSLTDPPLDADIPPDMPISYEIVEGGSKRGGRKLVSSYGYTYTVRRVNNGRTYWTCSVRGKTLTCHASVKQYGELYTPSINGHNHPAQPGILKKIKIASKVKQIAKDRMFEPASAIVERVMKETITDADFNLPKPDNLIRAANHHRRERR